MSDYETILIEREGRVARVSFNRPDKLNSFNGMMRRDFLRAAQEVNADRDIWVVLLTGAGRAFGAGADFIMSGSLFAGHDQSAGEVVEIGNAVSGIEVGDAVCALLPGGGYAEYVTTQAAHCLPIPDGFSLKQAACLPETFFTVWSNVIAVSYTHLTLPTNREV